MTPSGVLHITAFMTLCEACLGIDAEFNLWNYFFRIWHPQYSDAELTVSGGAIIHVNSGHGVDPYFNILIPKSMKWWQKKWFYLRNDASTSLPTFIGSCPIPLPSYGDGVARRDLSMLQPMREARQLLRQEGLIRVHLLQTFFSHWIQPLRWRKTKIWLYPRATPGSIKSWTMGLI
jgi:hypothetical protein